jgi:hypothetical protein
MKVEDAKTIVEELKGRFEAPFSSSDKAHIVRLYWEVLGKEFKPTSCQQCYHDALIEVYLYLKTYNKMKEKCNYRMRAGFIISCPRFANGKIYTNDNLTDEVAEEYLAQFPKNVEMFQQLPEGFSIKKVQKKVADRKKKQEKAAPAEVQEKQEKPTLAEQKEATPAEQEEKVAEKQEEKVSK